MERLFSDGESVLLGYGSDHRNPPFRSPDDPDNDSDIDFSDVFGGPPRKQSLILHEMRYSYSDSASSNGGDSAEISRSSPWSVRNEKPVFGEEASSRRRFTTDDFFNDIFRGNDSACNSPRRKKNEFDSAGSNPSSRVRSPTLPEPFGTSAPSQFSLPSRLHKDNASGGSSYYAHSPLSRSSNPIQDQDGSSKIDGETGSGNLKKGMIDPEVSKKVRNFHFSIYKWPNKGVPMSMPLGRLSGLRFKGKGNVEVVAEELLPSETLDDVHVKNPNGKAASVDSEFSKMEPEKEENVWGTRGQKPRTGSLSNKSLSGRSTNETPVDISETQKPKSAPLSKFLDDKDDEQDFGVHESKKKPDRIVNATVSSLPDEGETGKQNKIKGKVNEFVKIFNQGAQTRTDVEPLGQSSRFKTRVTAKTEIKAGNDNIGTVRPEKDVPYKEQKPTKVSEKQDSDKRSGSHKSHCASSVQEDKQEPSKGLTADDTDEPFHVTFQMKELTEDEGEILHKDKETEDFQAIEAKIRKWSSGKQGNIRSLLSTLQYILWQGSGWKQVPLMDMIEGNAVRKSYQRALLILHPDKLQQKGASSSQKYTAERVFELLQESWDHFNSLGPL